MEASRRHFLPGPGGRSRSASTPSMAVSFRSPSFATANVRRDRTFRRQPHGDRAGTRQNPRVGDFQKRSAGHAPKETRTDTPIHRPALRPLARTERQTRGACFRVRSSKARQPIAATSTASLVTEVGWRFRRQSSLTSWSDSEGVAKALATWRARNWVALARGFIHILDRSALEGLRRDISGVQSCLAVNRFTDAGRRSIYRFPSSESWLPRYRAIRASIEGNCRVQDIKGLCRCPRRG